VPVEEEEEEEEEEDIQELFDRLRIFPFSWCHTLTDTPTPTACIHLDKCKPRSERK
jgi:hypothetical protein